MPRHSSTKKSSRTTKSRPVDRNDAKIHRWNKATDIPLDEEDQFHSSRDKVLLDGDSILQQDDDEDDEVFALKGLKDDLDDEDDDVSMEEEDEQNEQLEDTHVSGKTRISKKRKENTLSDESDESEEMEETWGRTKSSWYNSNAVQLESDDEEGNELEVEEARRLQSKAREELDDGDFGLDDVLHEQGQEQSDDAMHPAPIAIEPLPQDRKLVLRHLEKTSPETLALARDWEDTIENLANTQERLASMELEDPHAPSLGMVHIYYQTLLTYSTILAFYFHLRSSEKYARRPELLRTHPVLQRLLKLKQSLAVFEDLDFDASDSDDFDDDEDIGWDDDITADDLWKFAKKGGLDKDELRLLLEEAPSPKSEPEPPRKKLKTLRGSKPIEPQPIFDLVEPQYEPSKAPTLPVSFDSGITDVYGESNMLHHVDAADKAARKKSLRFHTSKIESSSARRQGARSQAIGGDDDLPYRERRKERGVRLAKEDKKSRGQGGEDLDATEPMERVQSDTDILEGSDGYYELVKKKSKEKKDQKKAEHDAMRDAARAKLENEGPTTGPRSLTRAILTNKGLTPHRPKSVRNPRVKKRLRFDKAKKKLSSQKAVYKGGLANSGRYEGERSGISKVVKSVPLG